ncbi:oligosaccharide flippase family protein [Aquimarina sp. U1-2]|uniref:lipopolysaccharide biosynthesis protein n=1 Tax=Aquimarina sp. U1-2 TaxID=2823141 RepID=UPI001AECABFA|nr:oligosaccharide flippase family protein [Aquimarina sp. U1-2]MBP2832020.1 oligosaccharide flippase family protein [Aquimarina sp. U1-2]
MKINQLKGGAALSYVNILITNVIGLLLTPFIIRSLGQTEYGLYTMIGALVGYLTVFDFGLNNTIIRFVANFRAENDKKGEENFLAHSYIIYGFISLFILSVGFLFYSNLSSLYEQTLSAQQIQKAEIMFAILIFNLAISLPGGALTGICSGYEEFIFPKIVTILKYLIRSILVVGILLYQGDSVSLVILDTCMNLLIILINGLIVFKKLKVKIRLHKFEVTLLKTILGFSSWIFIFALVHQLRWQFGQLVLGLYYGTAIVAVYAVGSTLGNYYGAFSSAISNIFLPRAIQMIVKKSSKEELTNMFIKISRIILIVLLFIFGGFILVGRDFIYYWVGEEYNEAYYYTIFIMIGLTPILSQGFANNLLEAKKLLSYRGILLLTLTIMGTILGIYMAKNYGVLEMIASIVAFMLLERLIMIPYYSKHLFLEMGRYYKEISPLFIGLGIVLGISLTVNVFLPEQNLYVFISSVIYYSILYFAVTLLFMTSYEKSILKSFTNRIPLIRKLF